MLALELARTVDDVEQIVGDQGDRGGRRCWHCCEPIPSVLFQLIGFIFSV
jgi:hypothetical protein